MIDPGNEHHHHEVDEPAKNIARSIEHDADSGADATGTSGPEPGKGEHDAPETSGEVE